MDKQTVLRQMHELGYCLFDQFSPGKIGFTELGIVIRNKPTLKHFDPELLTLKVFQPDDTIESVSVGQQAALDKIWVVCPGRVVLTDRKHKRASFYGFGGSLEIIDQDDTLTMYLLASTAPILELGGDSLRIPNQLAAEVELMLAVFKAYHFHGDQCFDQRLARLEPLQFYRACLGSILMRFQRSKALKQTFLPLYRALYAEKTCLEAVGQWPEPAVTLGSLLLR